MKINDSAWCMWLKRVARRVAAPILKRKNFQMRPDNASKSGLCDLIESVGKGSLTMVEIGSYRGESAEVFLSTGKVAKIYCVDPWQMFYDANDGASFTDMVKVEQDFDRRHAKDSRVVKVKGTIDTFVEKFGNDRSVTGQIDLVYIDGLHTYEGVSHDIKVTMSKIKPRLAISGHDYYEQGWDGVCRAVNGMFGRPDATFQDGSWMKRLVADGQGVMKGVVALLLGIFAFA